MYETDYDLELELAKQRGRRYNEMLQQPEPQGQMVGGRYIAPGLEYVANALRSYQANKGMLEQEQRIKDLQLSKRQAIADALRGFSEKAQGTPENRPGDAIGPIRPAQAPDMAGAYASLMNAPDAQLRQLGMTEMIKGAQQKAEMAKMAQYRDIMANAQSPQDALNAGVPYEMVKQYVESKNLGRSKVARTVEEANAQGQKVIQQYDEYGNRVGEGVRGYLEPKLVNLGDRQVYVTPESGMSMGVNMAPGERERLKQAEEHFKATQAAPVYNPEAGGFIYKPTAKNPSGGFTPLAEKPEKPLNDTQSKSLYFGGRLKSANDEIAKLSAKGVNTTIPYTDNLLLRSTQSPEVQQLMNHKRDFFLAVTRRETGAGMPINEIVDADLTYFPQPGEGPEIIAQKAQKRKLATNLMLEEVPEGWRNKLDRIIKESKQAPEQQKQYDIDPKIEALMRKYAP